MIFAALILIALIASYCFNGDYRVRELRKKALKFIWVVPVAALLCVISMNIVGLDDNFLYNQMVQLFTAGVATVPFIIAYIVYKAYYGSEKTANMENVKIRGVKTENINGNALPSHINDRISIISYFQNYFGLCLSDQQVNSIAQCSFQSQDWTNEILAMQRSYSSPGEWYAQPTGWLHLYLKVYKNVVINQDFRYQYQLCMQSFDNTFRQMDFLRYQSVEDCVNEMNKTQGTDFDTMTFMMVHRLLEGSGRRYPLPRLMQSPAGSTAYGNGQFSNANNSAAGGQYSGSENSEISDLAKKYDDDSQGNSQGSSDNMDSMKM